MKTKFIKEKGLWYIDLPEYLEAGGSFADCQMVLGADVLLEYFSKGKNEISMELLTEYPINGYDGKLTVFSKTTELGEGADYQAEFGAKSRYDFYLRGIIWLCGVTKFLFNGEFPETLYIKILTTDEKN